MIHNLLDNRFDEKTYLDFLKETFAMEISKAEIKKVDKNAYIESYQKIGDIEIDDIDEVGFFIVRAKKENIDKIRIGFNAFIANLIQTDKYPYDGLIVAIYHPNSDVWRLSYVALELDDNRELSTKPNRYTFELGAVTTTTAKNQLKSLDKYSTLKEIKEAFSVEKVSKAFFNDYKALYSEICSTLIPQMAHFDEVKGLNFFAKKLLGRIVFLYFVQKKGWLGSKEVWGDGDKKFISNLYQEYKANDFYTDILRPIFFEALNTKRKNDYFKLLECKMPFLNGGLFTEDEFDKRDIIIEDKTIKMIIELFDSYNFTIIEDTPHDSEVAIDPEMLGRVFEDLLEDRKDKGAFYTPREIVHYMCQQSINNYLETKPKDSDTLAHIKEIKILDPAIGSGAFPMGMLHEIVQMRIDLGDTTLLSDLKREVIENSIYGIDIEPSAVEIAKLRFWLSIVVDEETPTPLPNLFYKIMVGNSLLETINDIDPLQERKKGSKVEKQRIESLDKLKLFFDIFYNNHNDKEKAGIKMNIDIEFKSLFDEGLKKYSKQTQLEANKKELTEAKTASLVREVLSDIYKDHHSNKIFLYKLFFREVLDRGENSGFDIIIGNPPYLRVQKIDKDESTRYKKAFISATGSYDLYVLFTEKALELLSPNGIANFIMPHKWINSSFGKGLRGLSHANISKFISFGAYQVFNASTYTSLVWFKKSQNEILDYVEVDRDLSTNKELEEYLFGLKDKDYTKIKNSDLGADSWTFTNKETYDILEKLKKQPLRVSDIFEKIFQGIATSKDSVYFLKNCRYENDLLIAFSDELGKDIKIEKRLVKPLLKGGDVHRYQKITSDKMVIFPYAIKNGKATLYTEEEIKEKFPNGYKYLKECENILRGREKGRFNIDGEWFQFGRKQGVIQNIEKLIQPDISLGGNYTYDDKGEYYSTATLYGYIKYSHIKESYKFYMSILNSKLFWWFLKNTGTTLTNNYFRFKTNYINPFPIPKIENIEDTKPFEILVDYVMFLKTQDLEERGIKYQLMPVYFEQIIDGMVYELYFEELLKKHDRDIIRHLGVLPDIGDMEDEEKISLLFEVFLRLDDLKHKVRNNLFYMDSIPEIKLIKGK